jgi:hypothetical protein
MQSRSHSLPRISLWKRCDPFTFIYGTSTDYVDMQARKSTHSFASSEEEDAALIENCQAVATTGSFMSTYFFH